MSGEMLAAIDAVQLASKAGRRAGGVMLAAGGDWVAVGGTGDKMEV